MKTKHFRFPFVFVLSLPQKQPFQELEAVPPVRRVQKQPPAPPAPLTTQARALPSLRSFPLGAGCWETKCLAFSLDAALEGGVAAGSTAHPLQIAQVLQGLTLIRSCEGRFNECCLKPSALRTTAVRGENILPN